MGTAAIGFQFPSWGMLPTTRIDCPGVVWAVVRKVVLINEPARQGAGAAVMLVTGILIAEAVDGMLQSPCACWMYITSLAMIWHVYCEVVLVT